MAICLSTRLVLPCSHVATTNNELQVAGNFHFAPGKSFQSAHNHVHDLQPFKQGVFNVSHEIHRISFGKEFPGIINPLDGVVKTVGT